MFDVFKAIFVIGQSAVMSPGFRICLTFLLLRLPSLGPRMSMPTASLPRSCSFLGLPLELHPLSFPLHWVRGDPQVRQVRAPQDLRLRVLHPRVLWPQASVLRRMGKTAPKSCCTGFVPPRTSCASQRECHPSLPTRPSHVPTVRQHDLPSRGCRPQPTTTRPMEAAVG